MPPPPFILASRRSPLAMRQSESVAAALQQLGMETKIIGVSTEGDEILDRPLAEIGGKELFIKRLQESLAAGEAHAAVHSLKDMAARQGDDFVLAAVGFGEDARDVVISRDGGSLQDLPPQASVGTCSPRRTALLRRHFPSLRPVPLRGNIHSRLDKLAAGECDALILAAAGLKRMGLAARICHYLPVDVFIPAVGQGLLGVECLSADRRVIAQIAAVSDARLMRRAEAERRYAAAMGGDCTTPLGAHASVADNNDITLHAFYAEDGGAFHQCTVSAAQPQAAGDAAAAAIRRRMTP